MLLSAECGAPRMTLTGRVEAWVKVLCIEAVEITRDRGFLAQPMVLDWSGCEVGFGRRRG